MSHLYTNKHLITTSSSSSEHPSISSRVVIRIGWQTCRNSTRLLLDRTTAMRLRKGNKQGVWNGEE